MTFNETQRVSGNHNTHPSRSARQIFDHLERRPESLEHPAKSRAHRIGAVALSVLEKGEGGKDTPYLHILRDMPELIDAQKALDEFRGHPRASREEITHNKLRVITVNHSLREVIDHNPNLRMSDMVRFIKEASLRVYQSNTDVSYSVQRHTAILEGMRHEVALEGLLYHIDGVNEVYPAGPEEELKGIDLSVDYKGTLIQLDAKASMQSAREKAENQLRHHNPVLPIWSGFKKADFNDTFRITDQDLNQEKARRVENILEAAYEYGSDAAQNVILYENHDSRARY